MNKEDLKTFCFTAEQRRVFTTEPNRYIIRGNKTIRKRCLEFVETLQVQQYKELPEKTAKQLFSETIDMWDRTTIKAYFGNSAYRSVKKLFRRKQYVSGTVSLATIELSQDVKEHKGYLEKLNLVHYEQRGPVRIMVLETPNITPELMKPTGEVCVSNDNLSLSLRNVEGSEGNLNERKAGEHGEGCPEDSGIKGGGEKRERV